MTLPIEKYNAMMSAKRFLYSLLDPKATPKVPRAVRMRARDVLKHYPSNLSVSQMEQLEKEHSPIAPEWCYRDYEKHPLNPEVEGY